MQNSVFFLIFAAASCFVFWKCRYGFGNIDESFYLTIPFRLYQGDALFQEEWHLSQMAGLLTYPIVAMYLKINGGTEGIILAMRYIWTLIQCLMSVFLYFRLKKINWFGAAVAAISYVLYTPFGIMALSYNSMGILFLLLSQVILLTAQKHAHLQYAIAGLSFAAAVLCCPYLLLVYVLYLAVVAILFVNHRKKEAIPENSPWSIKSAVFFTSGAAFAAVMFIAFVLARGSLARIIQAFPYIFDDPEHQSRSLFDISKGYIESIIFANSISDRIYCFLAGLWLLCWMDKKRQNHRLAYTCVLSAGILLLMLSHFVRFTPLRYINFLMWSVNIYAPFLLMLSQNSRIKKIFALVWIPGILYSYCLNIASNQEFYAISSASSVATAGSLLMLAIYMYELFGESHGIFWKGLAASSLALILVFQLMSQMELRYRSVFWEPRGMRHLTAEATTGIEKGLVMSEDAYAGYQLGLKVTEKISQYNTDNVLYLSMNTWYYLTGTQEMATYSAWISGVNNHSLNRLAAYYEINPHKMPDIVYVEPEYEEIAQRFCERFDYQAEIIDEGIVLLPNKDL